MPAKLFALALSLIVLSGVSAQSSVREGMSENLSSGEDTASFIVGLIEALLSASLSDEFYSAFFSASALYTEFSIASIFGAVAAFVISVVPAILLALAWYLPLLIPALSGACAGFVIAPLSLSPLAALLSLMPRIDDISALPKALADFIMALLEIPIGSILPGLTGMPFLNLAESAIRPPIFGLLLLPPILAILGALAGFLFPFVLLFSSLLIGFLLGMVVIYHIEKSAGISDLLAQFLMRIHSFASPDLRGLYDAILVHFFDGLKGAIETLSEPLIEMIDAT